MKKIFIAFMSPFSLLASVAVLPFLFSAITVTAFGLVFKLKTVEYFGVNFLLTVDQFVNVMMFGDPDETISSRAGRVFGGSWWAELIDTLMFWQTNHCHKAIEAGEGRRDILFPLDKHPPKK